jgi:hypothetical protein
MTTAEVLKTPRPIRHAHVGPYEEQDTLKVNDYPRRCHGVGGDS